MSSPGSAQTLPISARLPEVDGVRGLAIVLVLIWHYFVCTANIPTSPHWLRVTASSLTLIWCAMDLFFVLSGYLIGGVFLDYRRSPNLLKVFYIRRFFRIMPLYVIWVGLFFAGREFLPAQRFAWLFDHQVPTWGYFLFSHNIVAMIYDHAGPHWMGISWSLALEEQFYVLLSLLVLAVPPKGFPWVCGLMIVTAMPLRFVTMRILPDNAWAAWFPLWCRWDSLFCGVLLAWSRRQDWWHLTNAPKFRWMAWGIFLLGITWLMTLSLRRMIFPNLGHIMTYGITASSIMFTAMMFLVVHGSVLTRLLSWRPLVFMGTICYGVYLFHQAINGIFHGLIYHDEPKLERLDQVLVTLLATVTTILLAHLSYTKFEKPLIDYGYRWKYIRPTVESSANGNQS
jgi:peptidoglycan/LPS O-acetylase OafA/YrhL